MKKLRRLSQRKNHQLLVAVEGWAFLRPAWTRDLAVDDLPNSEDAPLKFQYGKDLLPSWILCDCPTYMKRMHNWYKKACRLGMRSLSAPHHQDVLRLKGPQINDIMFDFEDIQEMFRLSQLGIEMV